MYQLIRNNMHATGICISRAMDAEQGRCSQRAEQMLAAVQITASDQPSPPSKLTKAQFTTPVSIYERFSAAVQLSEIDEM